MRSDNTLYEPLLHEDLVTPIHHHDDARSHLVVRTEDGPRAMSPRQAADYIGRHRPVPHLRDVEHVEDGPRRVSRRTVLRGTTAGFGGLLAASATPRLAFADTMTGRDLLVVIFLRGGMDGLSAVAPLHDPALTKARRNLALTPSQMLALDSTYGMNRNLSGLKQIYDSGQLAVVIGAGHPSISRSHFEDMALVETSAPASMRSGWLGRHLQTVSAPSGTLRAITRGPRATLSLTTTAFDTVAVASLDRLSLNEARAGSGEFARQIAAMYGQAGGDLAAKAKTTLSSLELLAQAKQRGAHAAPAYPSSWDKPETDFVSGLKDIATLARSSSGLEVACLDYFDWDMHNQAGRADQDSMWFSRKARVLGDALAAFKQDLGAEWARTTVVTMSEFGRRVSENSSLGYDHGHGNVMFVMGGAVKGGRVYGSMPALDDSNLVMGDVPVTTDYRQVLSEIVSVRLRNSANLGTVFPGFTPGRTLGVV